MIKRIICLLFPIFFNAFTQDEQLRTEIIDVFKEYNPEIINSSKISQQPVFTDTLKSTIITKKSILEKKILFKENLLNIPPQKFRFKSFQSNFKKYISFDIGSVGFLNAKMHYTNGVSTIHNSGMYFESDNKSYLIKNDYDGYGRTLLNLYSNRFLNNKLLNTSFNIGNSDGIIGAMIGETLFFTELSAGEYYFSTTDANGCLIPGDEVFFTISDPEEQIMIDPFSGDVTCPDAEDGFINTTISGGTPPYTYQWYNDDGFSSEDDNITNLSGGTYTLLITDANDCVNETDIYISENEEIIIDATGNNCINNNGEIIVTTNGGASPYSYELFNLTNGTIITNNNDGIFQNLTEGDYSVLVTDNTGCVKSTFINLNAAPIADFYTDEYEFYLSNDATEFIDLSIDNNIMDWNWDFGDNNTSTLQNPNNLYMNPGNYLITLNIIDSMGCENSTTQEVVVMQDYYSYTPNIFTPNNDGINDTFSPSLFNIDTDTYNLMIFDRWGNKIFETNNYNDSWDGTLKNGSNSHPDLYSYKITYSTTRGIQKEEKGRVLMVR